MKALKKNLLITILGLLVTVSSWGVPRGASELIIYEQDYVNRSVDTYKIIEPRNDQAQQFSPEKKQVFEVKSFWVPADKLHIFEVPEALQNLGFDLERVQNGQRQILFLVHPESESFYQKFLLGAERGPSFEGTATASSRTLMMWQSSKPDQIFFGKLSLNKKIGGAIRTLPRGEIARSVGVTKILNAAQGSLPSSFAYFPEVFGAMPVGMARGGFLLRSIPPEILSGKSRLMPLFAVYTKPTLISDSPLELMIQKSGQDAKSFLVERILRPFAKQWLELAIEHGIVMEAHAQNVLMQIDSRGMPTGTFVYRDFGGFNIDLQFRRRKHLPMPVDLPVMAGEREDFLQEFHVAALKQSLQTYFEGGVLFGMGEELVRQGYEDLNYRNLTQIFRGLVKEEAQKKGLQLSFFRPFYNGLVDAVIKARAAVKPAAWQCHSIHQGHRG